MPIAREVSAARVARQPPLLAPVWRDASPGPGGSLPLGSILVPSAGLRNVHQCHADLEHPLEFFGRDRPPLHRLELAHFHLANLRDRGNPPLELRPVERREYSRHVALDRVNRTGPAVATLRPRQQSGLQPVQVMPTWRRKNSPARAERQRNSQKINSTNLLTPPGGNSSSAAHRAASSTV
jgi:hypothetical protein